MQRLLENIHLYRLWRLRRLILLSILFTVYFFRKLAAARTQIGAEW